MRLPPLSLVLGGVASGKSAFAERMVVQTGLAKVYLATAEAMGQGMAARVALHRARRIGEGWRTVEAPHDLARALARIDAGEVALVDSVSDWLSSLLIDDGDWEDELEYLIDTLVQMRAPVVLVSSDISGGLAPPDIDLAGDFQRCQGVVNQCLAAQADLVVLVTAGLPQVLKGRPELDPVDAGW